MEESRQCAVSFFCFDLPQFIQKAVEFGVGDDRLFKYVVAIVMLIQRLNPLDIIQYGEHSNFSLSLFIRYYIMDRLIQPT